MQNGYPSTCCFNLPGSGRIHFRDKPCNACPGPREARAAAGVWVEIGAKADETRLTQESPDTPPEFAIGDTVTLNGGGCALTVIEPATNCSGQLKVAWLDGKMMRTKWLPRAALISFPLYLSQPF